ATTPDVQITQVPVPDAASCHLAIGVESTPRPHDTQVDVWVSDPCDLPELWQRRLSPFAANLALRRRAPRRQRVVLAEPDPSWTDQAARLMARLAAAIGDRAHRIDHIGSTAVPGLPAKDIIDLQVVVDDLDTAIACAAESHRAGFVHVPGPFYGIDRHCSHHDEQVAVDADPGRPANVHFHPASSPIWREMLLLRNWLRADQRHRDEYASLKREVAAQVDQDVDAYGHTKMPWIAQALTRAENETSR
ncbi:dephospho-CoA kinase, partial [Actinomadura darangshiensis]